MQDTITILNEKLIQLTKMQPVGLVHGQMGVCIYLYKMSKLLKRPHYERIANDLLDVVHEKTRGIMTRDIENGVAGIGLGITYLIRILLNYNKMADDMEKIQYDTSAFYNRMITSPMWRILMKDEPFFKLHSGLSGFCGAALLLLNMKKFNTE